MSLTVQDIINSYQNGMTYNMRGTKPRFIAAISVENKTKRPIQLEGIKTHIASFLMDEVDLNVRDSNNNTALHIAINREMTDIARALIQDGADLEAINNWGSTPLHTSALGFSSACTELLLKYGANIDAKDIFNRTPLDIAFENTKNI